MTQQDRNTGIVGKPWPEQNFILQGKLNIMDDNVNVAIITAESRNGDTRLEVYQKIGVLFPNDKRGNEKAPDYTGPLDELHKDWTIAGWRGESKGKKYLSLKVSELLKKSEETESQDQESTDTSSQVIEDDIPF